MLIYASSIQKAREAAALWFEVASPNDIRATPDLSAKGQAISFPLTTQDNHAK